MPADAKGFADVVIGNKNPDAAFAEMADDALDIEDRDRIHARERLVEQDEQGVRGQRPRDLYAAALAARQADSQA